MGMFLLAASARGLFIAMLIIMIVVSLLFGFIVFMLLKPVKKSEAVDVNNVRELLARRETRLTVELMENKADETKKAELLNKLRRVKSAEMLVDELIEEEKAIVKAVGDEEKERTGKAAAERHAKKASAEVKKPVAQEGARGGSKPSAADGKPSGEKPADSETSAKQEKPSKPAKPQKPAKKKDDMEFNPKMDD